ncbi:MAG: hypothetical protein KKD31_19060 [Bacteroidetes bacterium]|nr:hypothetical protein [Bacteroidota bacterium]
MLKNRPYNSRYHWQILLFFCLSFLTNVALAERDSVNCYIEIQDLWDLDLNSSTVNADFYLVLEYEDTLNRKIDLINGTIVSIDTIIDDQTAHILSLRYNAILRIKLDFDKYPLDQQMITIIFEPFQYYETQVFFSMKEQNILVKDLSLTGWEAKEILFSSKIQSYLIHERNGAKKYTYSVAVFDIPIKRKNGGMYFLKTFVPSFISLLIIYFGLFFKSTQIEPRLNLSVGSLFVMISNFIVTQQMLPELSTITLIEKINILTLIIIMLTILYYSLAFRFHHKLKPRQWHRLNFLIVFITLSFFVGYILLRIS